MFTVRPEAHDAFLEAFRKAASDQSEPARLLRSVSVAAPFDFLIERDWTTGSELDAFWDRIDSNTAFKLPEGTIVRRAAARIVRI